LTTKDARVHYAQLNQQPRPAAATRPHTPTKGQSNPPRHLATETTPRTSSACSLRTQQDACTPPEGGDDASTGA